MATKDDALSVALEGDRLVISIGISTLAFAARHAPNIEQVFVWSDEKNDYDESRFKITDERVFAEAVKRELERETEDGTTVVHRMLDDAFMAAIEDGCEGVEIADDDGRSGGAR